MKDDVEVVDLLGDDSDGEVEPPSRPRKVVAAKQQAEAIDLCESSDDDDDKKPAAKPGIARSAKHKNDTTNQKKKKSAPKQKRAFYEMSSDEDEDDDDELLAGAGTRIFRSSSSSKDKPKAPPQPPQQSLTNAAFYVERAKQASASRRASLPSQKDNHNNNNNVDSVDLLSYSSGLLIHQQKKKQPSKSSSSSSSSRAVASMRRTNHYDSDDDDDDDDLLNFNSGLGPKQPPRSSTSATKTPASSSASTTKTPSAGGGGSVSSSSVVTNPYSKKKSRASLSSSSPAAAAPSVFPYPKLTANAKQYPDERARFLTAFWKYGRSISAQSFQRPKLDAMAKKVVKLALSEFPIRSLEEFAMTGGTTSVTNSRQQRNELRADLDNGGLDSIQTPVEGPLNNNNNMHRQYYSITEACLVALLQEAESRQRRDVLSSSSVVDEAALADKEMWMALQELIPAIDEKLRKSCPGRLTRKKDADGGVAHYCSQSTRSIEFLQVAKLENKVGDQGPFIKRHSVKGQPYYELLPAGYQAAVRIRTRQFPAPPGHYRSSKIQSMDQVDKKRYDNIVLGVDLREGGGGAKTLHQMCKKLELMQCPYFVGSLSIGDYVFFTNKDGTGDTMNHLCPIVVERKAIQDVAQSIHDGRWTRQKHRMYVAQYVFGYDNCRMVYIIEGNENKQTVSGDYVGARWFNVNKERLKEEIDNLKSEGFDVLRTTSVENSMFELARWAQRVSKEMKEGKIKAQFTYAEFKKEVAEIPAQTDFSRLAKWHMKERLKKEALAKRLVAGDDSDSEIEVLSVSGGSLPRGNSSGSKKPAASSRKEPPSKKQKTEKDEDQDDDYFGWAKSTLMEECEAAGLPRSGSRKDLVARLKGPRPPRVWLERKRRKEYVPARHDVAGTALLVALYLHETEVGLENAGLTKEELYVKAEGLDITKNPFSGGTTQTGPYHYDGWSSMSSLLKGDPALVTLKQRKYRLTRSCDIAGFELAKAMHRWCHEYDNCPCGAVDF